VMDCSEYDNEPLHSIKSWEFDLLSNKDSSHGVSQL
jgi:hypothetical protein